MYVVTVSYFGYVDIRLTMLSTNYTMTSKFQLISFTALTYLERNVQKHFVVHFFCLWCHQRSSIIQASRKLKKKNDQAKSIHKLKYNYRDIS